MSNFNDAITTLRRLSTSTSHPTIAGHARRALAAAAEPESVPRAAAAEPESSGERMQLAIRELGAISRSATHPDRHRARRALLEMQATYEGRTLVSGASYESEHAAQLDREMGLTTAGQGVRVEGSQLILSAGAKGAK